MNNDERLGLPSASAMGRIMLCPGSHRMEKKAIEAGMEPSKKADAWAEMGTQVHAEIARILAQEKGYIYGTKPERKTAKETTRAPLARTFAEATDKLARQYCVPESKLGCGLTIQPVDRSGPGGSIAL